ncbi:hypothetical protein SYNPS1DRAFT_24437, partial [Syncephalis pseudoplumigaleata]
MVQSHRHSLDDGDSDVVAVSMPLTAIGASRRRSLVHTDSADETVVHHRHHRRSESDTGSYEEDHARGRPYPHHLLALGLADEPDGDGDQRGLLSGSMKYRAKTGRGTASDNDGDDDDADDAHGHLMIGQHQTAGIMESFLNMANSIVGAGIIGLPYSFREAGFWSGIILLVVLTLIVDWTVSLLIKN